MKIKLTRDVNIPDGLFQSGSVIETSDDITARLIDRGHAVKFVECETAAMGRDEVETTSIRRKAKRK